MNNTHNTNTKFSKKSYKLAIFGYPLSHSKSPIMQNKALECIGLKPTYKKIEIKNATNNRLKKAFLKHKLKGANITLPHKEEAYKQADKIKGEADKIKAVNTYVYKKGKIIGYNTDIYGFSKSIMPYIKKHRLKKVLILGAGGVSRAVAIACVQLNLKTTVANRSKEKLAFFKNAKCKTYIYTKLVKKLKKTKYDLIINATSVGLKDDALPLSLDNCIKLFKNAKYIYDCIYGKKTAFLKLANKQKIKHQDGLNMLLFQGIRALELFLDIKCSKKTQKIMRKTLM